MNSSQTDQRRETILIAPQNLYFLREILESEGYGILAAPNGEVALETVSHTPPDLILLDVLMPNIDGFEVCRRLKADAATANIPVIFITARSEAQTIVEGFQVGGADYITKPFRMEEVLARFKTHLGINHLTKTLAQKNAELDRRATEFRLANQKLQEENKRVDDLLNVIIPIGVALSAEKDGDRLLERILLEAKSICNADGGTLYLHTEDNRLKFAIMHTNSLPIALGGTTGKEISAPLIPLYDETTGEPNHNNVASHAALTGSSVNIPDAYAAEGFDFSGTKEFDERNSYRSISFLTIPLKNHLDEVIGVLQLLNAQDRETGEVIPFAPELQRVIESLASLAATALDNQMLLQSQKDLLDSFIEVIADAIDAKSPYTAGHCARVPIITEMVVDSASEATTGLFKDFNFTEEDRYELRIASLLHDAGKVTTPVHVVDKATKLETICDRINTVKTRFEVLKRDAEIAYLKALTRKDADLVALETDFQARLIQFADDQAFIESVNFGGEFMDPEKIERIQQIEKYRWTNADGVETNFLTEEEVYNLCIPKGTLTPEEREVINNHVVITINMLEKLPFPRHLRRVPEYAGAHHERMDGTGYPRGLTGDQMSIPARAMAIADVFEALTASDRPYKKLEISNKKHKPLSEVIRIMGFMTKEGHLDPDLFDLFVESGIYRKYAEEYLQPDQIDDIDN